MPFVYANGSLCGHVARVNYQWKRQPVGEALMILRGPDTYISPSWYPSKQEHGRVVPTWNYDVVAHGYGRFVVHDDPDWVSENVRSLTRLHQQSQQQPWWVEDAPEKFFAGQLRAIVGVEVVIDRIEAKFKLIQNRQTADVDGVIAALSEQNDPIADLMRGLPH